MTGTTAANVAPDIDLDAEQAIQGWDWLILIVVVGVALLFLTKRLWRRKGGCAGCGRAGACAAQQPAADRSKAGPEEHNRGPS